MEVPVINRIGDFENGLTSLQTPSFLSRAITFPGIDKIPQPYSFWKWGALLLAFVATFTTIFNRLKILIRTVSSPPSQPLLVLEHSEYEVSSDEDDSSSSYSSSEDEAEEDDAVVVEDLHYDDFCVAGGSESDRLDDDQWKNRKFMLRQRRSNGDRFSWSEFANGKSVVKLWDGLGLGLDLSGSSGSVISIYDLNREHKISSIFGEKCQIPAVSSSSPSVFLSAGVENNRNLSLKVWDPRVGCQIPAIFAEWRALRGKVVGINSSGVEKVYVRDDIIGDLTVRDMRNVNSPLENLAESDRDTWWDADAVMVNNECFE